jgi:hypothetical protein
MTPDPPPGFAGRAAVELDDITVNPALTDERERLTSVFRNLSLMERYRIEKAGVATAALAYAIIKMSGGSGICISVAHEACPSWLRIQAYEVFLEYGNGIAETCQHQPKMDDFSTVMAAVWRPHVVSCPSCVPVVLPAPEGTDFQCDGCGRDFTGTGKFMVVMVTSAMMIYQAGACEDCRPQVSMEPTPSTTK